MFTKYSALLALAFVFSCVKSSRPIVSLNELCPEGYEASLERWTRKVWAYDGLSSAFHVISTLKSDAFERCFTSEVRSRRGLAPLSSREVVSAEAPQDRPLQILLALYTPLTRDNTAASPHGMWNIHIERLDGSVVAMTNIRRLKKNATEHAAMLPYLERWFELYLLEFPREGLADPSAWSLKIGSLLGHVAIQWGQ